jgi:hypothetical protein
VIEAEVKDCGCRREAIQEYMYSFFLDCGSILTSIAFSYTKTPNWRRKRKTIYP